MFRSQLTLFCEWLARAGFLSSAILIAGAAQAQDLEPRAYSNAPTGMNFVLAGYSYSQGDVAFDPSSPLEDGDIDAQVGVFAYIRSFALGQKSAKIAAALPYGCIDGSAQYQGERVERHICGAGDAKAQLAVNLYGAPALSLPEFQQYRQDLIIGAALGVSAPTGQYDDDRLVNIGTNRWSIKPEIGLSKAIDRLTLELTGAATFFGDNDNFFGGQLREQDPLYAVQGHIIYSFARGIWGAINGTHFVGGRTTTDGVQANDMLQNSRLGATLAVPVDRHNSIKLYLISGVSTRTGGDFDTFGMAWQTRWGGGM